MDELSSTTDLRSFLAESVAALYESDYSACSGKTIFWERSANGG